MVTAPAAVAKAFSPGHVTGFFEIPKLRGTSSPQYRGSRGAGFSIDRGISTTVHVFEDGSGRTGSKILINGRAAKPRDAEVSQWIVDRYAGEKNADKPFFVRVEHEIDIPVGFGLGSSGAAALSLSYALNAALGSRRSMQEAAQLAHEAEIACRTGLGTVIAEYAGGFEMRTGAGAPGIGTVERIPLEGHYKAVILCISPISTKAFLANRMDTINGLGGKMLDRLAETRSVDDFMKMSYQFADTLGLTEGRCRAPVRALREAGFECSVALFGETVFTIVPEARAGEAAGVLQKFFEGTLLVCDIDGRGARVL
ncbi:putative GHMP kinase [Nitrososphaera viennensis EN76]|uniref:Pantoate kinase n=1 Tax=Nitrososphaera viennensis EN76 TaxID=926571 RepID=A0A060HJJ7_9ARCH|nr:putative GHMP kinase [Nitrososphaera viennensis EN76]